ncbi:MAG: hypothetical protein Tsb0016_06220 [Sphingomonadales bacterium]
MFRTAWLVASLAVAIIASLLLYGSLPVLLSWALPARTPQAVIDIISQATLPAIAVFGAGLVLFYNLIGPGGLALFDMLTTKRARANLTPLLNARRAGQSISRRDFLIALEDTGDLTSIAEDYAAQLYKAPSLQQELATEDAYARLTAAGYFGPEAMVERRLMTWLSQLLCGLLLGGGALLFLISLVIGTDNAIFGGRLGGASGEIDSFKLALETGLITLAIAGGGALLSSAWIYVVRNARSAQAYGFARDLDIIFLNNPGLGLATAPAPAQASAALDASALEQFADRQAQLFSEQSSHLREVLEAAAAAAQRIEAAAKGSDAAALQQLADQARALNKTMDGMGKSLRDLRPLLEAGAENSSVIRQHLTSDASTAQHLQKAAKDMGAAAQASRDTVERFITLAEKLREAARALTGPSGEVATPADPEAARRLSEALRELRRVAGGGGR